MQYMFNKHPAHLLLRITSNLEVFTSNKHVCCCALYTISEITMPPSRSGKKHSKF